MKKNNSRGTLTIGIGSLLGLGSIASALAQSAPSTDNGASVSLNPVVVTGSRASSQRQRDSSTPVQVVTAQQLVATGQGTLLDALKTVVPSLTTPAVGYDAGALARTFQLRGLGPAETLVLVNGKRRHLSASLYADEDPAQGANAVDLDLIPIAAIDHVEVLLGDAAAQYGSDAIAGVINIVLKKQSEGTTITASGGGYLNGGGATGQIDLAHGMAIGDDGSLTLSATLRHHSSSDRSSDSGGPEPARVQGDPQTNLGTFGYNFEKPLNANITLYSFGTVSDRDVHAYEDYRSPSYIASSLPGLESIYPNGFSPIERSHETDYSFTVGVKGTTDSHWDWDLSTTYGRDEINLWNVNTANYSLLTDTGSTPTQFKVGSYTSSELTTNLDLKHSFAVPHWASPVNVAVGLEHRYETFALDAGDAASYYDSGAVAFPGYRPTDAASAQRNSIAAYADVSTHILPKWQIDAAVRGEDYQRLGASVDGTVSTRYDFSPALGLRGSAGTGTHAPTLVQEYYSATNVTTGGATIQIPLDSAGARILGAPALKNETSKQFSIGFVAQPLTGLHLSVDAYQIDVNNRIVDSGQISGSLAAAAIAANGTVVPADAIDNTYAQFFTNGANTRTRGIDAALDYRSDFGRFGRIDWNLNATYNRTTIRSVNTPASLAAAGVAVLDSIQVSNLTTATPRIVISGTGAYTYGPWHVTLRETYYGKSSQTQWATDYSGFYADNINPAFITDLDVAYRITRHTTIAIGANNLFNKYPNQTNPNARPNYDLYPHLSPYGINGAYYYARLTVVM
ncbi:iron complex outermembrane receptor protein [Paraburkholderia eburnea]|uniref:Iron complex outermembrane receptor protein n=1 Tax=Paraburkholderia eburnea TaxID=1189126 RepID=A0A2S4LWT2_9BURK|nr:iron complex outermembrane receptor protein [Paraburkholderia eburnea]PRZ18014.1 iron complex outermembrane receptor protein [Paraburkholderia eburnea]